jgi:V8-like Glu-specific endopeptidase
MNTMTVLNLSERLKVAEFPSCDPLDLDRAVRSIADEILSRVATVDQICKVLKILNAFRHFDYTRTLGKTWIDCRNFDATIAKHYAQSLIELFELDTAENFLNDSLEKAQKSPADAQVQEEIFEYYGLLGRVEKQRFVSTGNKQRLVEATNRYLSQFDDKRHSCDWFWYAINAIALVAREQREGITPGFRTRPVPTALDVYNHVKKLYETKPDDPWILATASEAALACGKCEDAELWLYRFLNHENVQPFYIQSYDRQLREIWQGNPTRGGNNCADRLARMTARHIIETQAQFSISPLAIPALKKAVKRGDLGSLEKNFLGESNFSVANIRDMLYSCSSIGCVMNGTGSRLGTGFLVEGACLGFKNKEIVFVTNSHVISSAVSGAILPSDALVMFEVEWDITGKKIFYGINEVLFESPPGNLGVPGGDTLDVVVVTLRSESEEGAHFTALKTVETLPLVNYKSRVYVVGHPMGGGLQIALNDSLLLDIDDNECLIHYRTPTDPGSSGSPVFNSDWEVIGVHHGGSSITPRLHGDGNYEANEAVSLKSIKQKIMRTNLSTSS